MDLNFRSTIDNVDFKTIEEQASARKFISNVYLYMMGALLISGIIAYRYGTIDFVLKYYFEMTPTGPEYTPLFYVIVFSPVAIALALQWLINRVSFVVLFALFVTYAVLIGFSLATIFIVYTQASIFVIFGIAAGMFGIMALLGYTTKADLTRLGSILGMAFLGLIIASIVNFWLKSDAMGWWMSLIGAIIFPGLIAFHMQQLKKYAYDSMMSEEQKNKMALLGGFTLYVLFVNLFLSLLRLFGERN
jgi:FtsH-binding integral membrane protein